MIKPFLRKISRRGIINAIINNKDNINNYIKENMPSYFEKKLIELIYDYD